VNSNFKNALLYSLKLLSRRDYSEKEICRKLAVKFPDAETEEVIKNLKENRYLSDYRVAYNYALSKMEKGWGKRKIKFYLFKKGVDEETVDTALNSIEFDYSFIKKELEKRFDKPKEKKEREKIERFLSQRGFSYLEIFNLISDKI